MKKYSIANIAIIIIQKDMSKPGFEPVAACNNGSCIMIDIKEVSKKKRIKSLSSVSPRQSGDVTRCRELR